MAYLATRGNVKTTVQTNSTSGYSYYTSLCTEKNVNNAKSVPTYTSYTSSASVSSYYYRTSADGGPITISRGSGYYSVTEFPDGNVVSRHAVTSGLQVRETMSVVSSKTVTTSVAKYSGPAHCNPTENTKKICLRTGTGENDVVKYGLTTNTGAKEYCGFRMNIDGKTAYIGRSVSSPRVGVMSRNALSSRSTSTVTMTSTVSSYIEYSSYTYTGNIDSGSYSYASPGGVYYAAGEYSTSYTGTTAGSGTSSWIELRSSSWPYTSTTSKIAGTTWTSTTGTSYVSSYTKYANSTYTSYYSHYSESIKTSMKCSGNRSTRCKNDACIGDFLMNTSGFYYSIYETYSASGRSATTYYTQPTTTYYTNTRTTTSRTTFINSESGTYVSKTYNLSTSISSNSGTYTATSFAGYRNNYVRSTYLSKSYTGSANLAATHYSTGCDITVSTMTTGSASTNRYYVSQFATNFRNYSVYGYNQVFHITSMQTRSLLDPAETKVTFTSTFGGRSYEYITNSSLTVTTSSVATNTFLTDHYSYSTSVRFTSSKQTIASRAAYSSRIVDSSTTLTIRSPSCNQLRLSEGYCVNVYVEGNRRIMSVTSASVYNGLITSSISYLSGTAKLTSKDGRAFTVSIPSGNVSIQFSGSSRTATMASYTTSMTETYYSSTYVTVNFNTLHGVDGTIITQGGPGQSSTKTDYFTLTRYYTRTRTATMTQTDYLNAKKMLSTVTTGTRTTTYSTSRYSTYSNSTLTTTGGVRTTSWYQRTTATGTLSSSSSTSTSGIYSTTQRTSTLSSSFPATSSYYLSTNLVDGSYSGTSNTTSTYRGTASLTMTSANGYTMSATMSSISSSTSSIVASTYTRLTTSYFYRVNAIQTQWAKTTTGTSSKGMSSTYVSTNGGRFAGPYFTMSRGAGLHSYTYIYSSDSVSHYISYATSTKKVSLTLRSNRESSSSASVTYSRVWDAANKRSYFSYPNGVIASVKISSSNHSTYSSSSVNYTSSRTTSNSYTGSNSYLESVTTGTISSRQSFVTSSCTWSVSRYTSTTSHYSGPVTMSVYSGGNYVTSRYSLNSILTSIKSRSVSSSSWKNEIYSSCTNSTMSGRMTVSAKLLSASSMSKASSSSVTYGPYNQGTLTVTNTGSNSSASSSHFTISTSSTVSSITSRTTFASSLLSATTHNYTYYSTYDYHIYSSRSSVYYSTWTGYEYFRSVAWNASSTTPYIIASRSQVSYGKELGVKKTSLVTFMSLPTGIPNLCTYSTHTSSNYTSASSTSNAMTNVSHGFVSTKSSSSSSSNLSARIYEITYDGYEVYVNRHSSMGTGAGSYTQQSSLELGSFLNYVSRLAHASQLLMSSTKATMTKSFMSYLVSTAVHSYRSVSNNYGV